MGTIIFTFFSVSYFSLVLPKRNSPALIWLIMFRSTHPSKLRAQASSQTIRLKKQRLVGDQVHEENDFRTSHVFAPGNWRAHLSFFAGA